MASISSFLSLILQFLLILSTLAQSDRQSPNYTQFVVNATNLPSEESYDYIIVGGGTAGCPLAATLSKNYRVLLLERGGLPIANPNVMTRGGFLPLLTQFDQFDSPAQPFISEDGVPNARVRVLGGSSAINAGFYSRTEDPGSILTRNWCSTLMNGLRELLCFNRSYRLGNPRFVMDYWKQRH